MDVISAIATAPGRGGVAIVRMSGEGALSIARRMFSRRGEYLPNVMYAGKIDCGSFEDYGMCVYFRAPKSFTGEDTVEFHCHGGTEIARGVLEQTLALGARAAERGEFTKRAFLNGKLSLSAAEGMADMINAEARAQVRAGFMLYGEKLTNEGKRLQALLTECLASIDADVDYPEEDLNAQSREEVVLLLKEVQAGLSALLKQYRAGRKIKSGVNAVICGKPNAGKSSLLNALLGCDKAIVSPVAGTTRDAVEGSLEINGVLFRLTDTAGLRESGDEIEREGIRRDLAQRGGGNAPRAPEGNARRYGGREVRYSKAKRLRRKPVLADGRGAGSAQSAHVRARRGRGLGRRVSDGRAALPRGGARGGSGGAGDCGGGGRTVCRAVRRGREGGLACARRAERRNGF